MPSARALAVEVCAGRGAPPAGGIPSLVSVPRSSAAHSAWPSASATCSAVRPFHSASGRRRGAAAGARRRPGHSRPRRTRRAAVVPGPVDVGAVGGEPLDGRRVPVRAAAYSGVAPFSLPRSTWALWRRATRRSACACWWPRTHKAASRCRRSVDVGAVGGESLDGRRALSGPRRTAACAVLAGPAEVGALGGEAGRARQCPAAQERGCPLGCPASRARTGGGGGRCPNAQGGTVDGREKERERRGERHRGEGGEKTQRGGRGERRRESRAGWGEQRREGERAEDTEGGGERGREGERGEGRERHTEGGGRGERETDREGERGRETERERGRREPEIQEAFLLVDLCSTCSMCIVADQYRIHTAVPTISNTWKWRYSVVHQPLRLTRPPPARRKRAEHRRSEYTRTVAHRSSRDGEWRARALRRASSKNAPRASAASAARLHGLNFRIWAMASSSPSS